MLTGALSTQLPEDQGNVCDWGLGHSSQETMISKKAGFGRDTLCIVLSTANGHSVSCRGRGAATRNVFWSLGKQYHSQEWHLSDKIQVRGMVGSPI